MKSDGYRHSRYQFNTTKEKHKKKLDILDTKKKNTQLELDIQKASFNTNLQKKKRKF